MSLERLGLAKFEAIVLVVQSPVAQALKPGTVQFPPGPGNMTHMILVMLSEVSKFNVFDFSY